MLPEGMIPRTCRGIWFFKPIGIIATLPALRNICSGFSLVGRICSAAPLRDLRSPALLPILHSMSSSSSSDSTPPLSVHLPVLMREVLRALDPQPGQIIVDGTAGGGGHSREILKRIGDTGTLIGLDRDPMMLQLAAQKVQGDNVHLIHASYALLPQVLEDLGIAQVDGILLDLGLSSDQLADRRRGFGFAAEGPLDLRFDTSAGEPAWQLLERLNEEELATIFTEFGEERFASQIAARIVETRKRKPILTAQDLTAVVTAAVTSKRSDRQPATRVFQALRIATNEELGQLEVFLKSHLQDFLKTGGRGAIISFHSLEDRLVKNAFRDKHRFRVLTPKPVIPAAVEQRANPRSRSAKLRAVERL